MADLEPGEVCGPFNPDAALGETSSVEGIDPEIRRAVKRHCDDDAGSVPQDTRYRSLIAEYFLSTRVDWECVECGALSDIDRLDVHRTTCSRFKED